LAQSLAKPRPGLKKCRFYRHFSHFGMIVPYEPAVAVALIWLADCGIGRARGYGLKFRAGFGFTHLGRIGRAA
jgi:Domain of unknown function (DUF4260)